MAGEATYGADAAKSSAGMPQLAFETFPNQIFWLIVALIVIYFVLSRIALPRIGSIIEERHGAIENDLERAADYKRQAEEAEVAYTKALSEAKAEAGQIANQAKAAVQAEVDKAIAKADVEIAAQAATSEARIQEIRDGAVAAVDMVAKETAIAVITAIDADLADADAVNAAVAARLN